MADARKEGWEELDPSDVLIEYENEEVEEGIGTPYHPTENPTGFRRSSPEERKKIAAKAQDVRTADAKRAYAALEKGKSKRAGPGMVGVRGSSRHEDVEEDATYSERISSDVPAGNASKARGTSKVRKYRQVTPGQVRDYEKLSAARMFQAYEESEVEEDAPANNTSGVANFDPLLGGNRSPRVLCPKA